MELACPTTGTSQGFQWYRLGALVVSALKGPCFVMGNLGCPGKPWLPTNWFSIFPMWFRFRQPFKEPQGSDFLMIGGTKQVLRVSQPHLKRWKVAKNYLRIMPLFCSFILIISSEYGANSWSRESTCWYTLVIFLVVLRIHVSLDGFFGKQVQANPPVDRNNCFLLKFPDEINPFLIPQIFTHGIRWVWPWTMSDRWVPCILSKEENMQAPAVTVR